MTGMHLNGIESRLASQTHGIAIVTCHRGQFVGTQSADEGGRIEVES